MPKLKYRSTLPRPHDPDILRAIFNAVKQGHPIATAAQLAGIGEMTARDWLHAGERALLDWDGVSELGSHALFAWTLKQAEAQMVEKSLATVHRDMAHKGGWVAGMTLLERRRPQDFGRHDRTTVESKSLSVSFTLDALTPEQQRAIAETILKRTPAPTPALPPPDTSVIPDHSH